MRGLGATSLIGGPQLPLTRLLVHFDNETMPPIDERGASYTVVQAGQSLVADGAYFGERCLHNNRGCGYFTPSKAGFYDSTERDCCLEAFVKIDTTNALGYEPNSMFLTLLNKNHRLVLSSYNNSLAGNGHAREEFILNEWNHVAIYVFEDNTYVALNGVASLIYSYVAQNPDPFDYLCVGCASRDPDKIGVPLLGHIDELRYSVGTSRYTPQYFMPPDSPFVLD